jgi:hypothetical protein
VKFPPIVVHRHDYRVFQKQAFMHDELNGEFPGLCC